MLTSAWRPRVAIQLVADIGLDHRETNLEFSLAIENDLFSEKIGLGGIRTTDLPRRNPMRRPPDHGDPSRLHKLFVLCAFPFFAHFFILLELYLQGHIYRHSSHFLNLLYKMH